MKKLISLLLCTVMLALLAACSGGEPSASNSADTGSSKVSADPTAVPFDPIDWSNLPANDVSDFTFTNGEKGIAITGYVGTNPVMRIPDSINGTPVTEIAVNAFSENTVITHAYLSDSIEYFEEGIFEKCTSLQQVHLPEKLRYLEKDSFYGCSALQKVEMSEGVEFIGESAFMDCTALTEMHLPASVASFKEEAFSGCTALKSIYAPGLQWINDGSLMNCSSLTDLTIYAVGTIEGHAFNGCTSLASVEILPPPADCPFSFHIFENGVIYKTSHGAKNVTAIRAMPGIAADEIVLREDTNYIDSYCFRDCRIKRAAIPAAVYRIDSEAFGNCRELESVSLAPGSGLHTVGFEVFKDCQSLKTVDFSATSETLSLGYSPFTFAYALEKVVLPDSIASYETPDGTFSTSKKVTVTYRGKDYTYDELSTLVFSE